MKIIGLMLLAFLWGYVVGEYAGKTGKGAEWGYKAGRWTRTHILRLPPADCVTDSECEGIEK